MYIYIYIYVYIPTVSLTIRHVSGDLVCFWCLFLVHPLGAMSLSAQHTVRGQPIAQPHPTPLAHV